jgi:hypothetical protein
LKVPIVRDRRARHAYVRAITEGCKALGIEPPSLETLDPPDEVSLEGMIRFHVIDRFMGWEKPRLDALESYVEPGSWINWRQHPWTPSGIERVSADPEEAWADFVVWCKDGPCQSAEPLMRKETYLRVFTQNKPYHPWQLRAPEDPELRPAAHP